MLKGAHFCSETGAGIERGGGGALIPPQMLCNREDYPQTQQRPENLRFQAAAGDLLGLDWGLRALVRMPEP